MWKNAPGISDGVEKTRVIFSDVFAIYQSTRSRNIVFWSKQNPHYCKEVEPDVMVGATINSEHLFGPYFFHGPVNYPNYLTMLRNCFIQ